VSERVIVVGVDGSAAAQGAVGWCVEHAPLLDAEVVAVHAVELPIYVGGPFEFTPPAVPGEEWRADLHRTVEQEWCAPLHEAGIPFRVVVEEGSPAGVLSDVAAREHASLVVVNRRGRGGFTELVLGSVSHQLAHHAPCPLVIVPAPAR